MTIDPNQLLAIGHITRPRGTHGEVSAVPLAPPMIDPARLMIDRKLWVRDEAGKLRRVRATRVRRHQGRWLVQLEGCETMDDAQLLREHDLCLAREDLPALPEGWYWEEDLKACVVVDATLGEIGPVEGLDVAGAQTQLLVQRPEGKEARIPWVKALIVAVDLEAGQIRTDLPADYPGISDEPRTPGE